MEKQEKRSYLSPVYQIVSVSETTYLMDSSFPSQHAPAQSGGSHGDAKQAPSWMTESEDATENPSWED